MIGLNDGGGALPLRVRELTADIFAEGGLLATALDLEHRPEQERMARAVAAAFAEDRPLLVEAGTGVGKSLAYLVPGIVFAVEQKRQLVVSTHTISLQEQVEHKDLPHCRRLFAAVPALAPFAEFRSTLLVGKSNYLCTTRLGQALQDRAELFATAEQTELQRVAAWAARSSDGLRHELNPAPADEVWDLVNADSGVCSRRNCDPKTCFYQKARARVDAAHVLVVNHSLLFSLLNLGHLAGREGVRGVLRPDDFVVLDEAHTVPEVATDHTGTHVTNVGVERLLRSLFHPTKRRGLLAKHGTAADQQAVGDALEASAVFFEYLREKLLSQHAIVRLRFPDAAEPLLDAPLLGVINRVADVANRLADGSPPRDELLDKLERLKGYRAEIARWLGLAEADSVYWLERGGRQGLTVTLRAAPLDVAPYLRENLFRRDTSVVLTSATLTVGGAIEPFQQRVGAEAAAARVERSPFDFERQMRVYVAEDMAPPSAEGARLDVAALADYIGFCALRNPGGSLVLFTSYADMRAVSERLAPGLAAADRLFLMQGRDGSRTELTQRLRRAGNAVLFGTDSFWTGVDVPGRALSQVIITRLPFDPPTHPVAEARAERVRAQGGSPFNELTLPDALMKFRQGVGRLIRQQSDRGVVTLLDSRILTKAYGRDFLASLPTTAFERLNRANREALFRPFP
ncbi:MAG TPA: helicase C-terminal domain-containing protein [Opitutaceae bacterium]|nr:helicase C-terminal domain-containing protein [Opitutaceae bacterium]